MARRELGPAALEVGRAVAAALPPGRVVVGCSGGADSLALALAARWAARGGGTQVWCVVVDHGLQDGSASVAAGVAEILAARGMEAQVRRVVVDTDSADGLEAAARDARLAALASDGHPVLLGHTLDDQAESVLLGLLRGSGTRSLAGMAPVRDPFLRPLLGVRRATTEQACVEWGVVPWRDPHNDDERFTRVRARRHLAGLATALGRDVAPALARTAALARTDADFLDDLARQASAGWGLDADLDVQRLGAVPDALRPRILRDWLARAGVAGVSMSQLAALDALVVAWAGQGPVDLPGATVGRRGDTLRVQPASREQ